MAESLRIRQAKSGYRREFLFGDERLTCTLRDPSGERQFSVPYEAIDVTSPSTLTLNKTPLVGWVFLLGLAIIISAMTTASAELPNFVSATLYVAGLAAMGAVIANRWTGWFSVKFTLMQISPPPPGTNAALMVIHDHQHEAVMETLRSRWKERLKALHGRANLSADRARETARLAWLRDKGVIDEFHYAEEIKRLEALDTGATPSAPMIN